jgi:hypothetical protein
LPDPGANPGRRRGKSATNRFSYGATHFEYKFLLPGYEDYMHEPLDVSDMMQTFWRLITNPTLMCNNLASVFYFLGYMPYWVFMAKYIETQYRQSASTSSLITGKLTVSHSLRAFALVNSNPHNYVPSMQLFIFI